MFYEDLFSQVTYDILVSLEESGEGHFLSPGIYHSVISTNNFAFCSRLDWYCILDKAKGDVLFVDTGHPKLMGTSLFEKALEKAGASWKQAKVVLTHFHIDHSGNLAFCLESGAESALFIEPVPFRVGSDDAFLRETRSSAIMRNDVRTHEHLDLLFGEHYYDGIDLERCSALSKGDAFDIGSYHFEVMPTPGHCPEHLCLVDKDNKLMFAGDHLIFAKPGMMQLEVDQHLMATYMESLSTIRKFKLEKVFMSHHDALFGNKAIDDFLKKTQEAYCDLLKTMKERLFSLGAMSAYEMASVLAAHHPNGIDSFKPDMQMRRVALMLGTLEGLHDEGMAERRQDDDGAYVYFIK